MKHEHTDDAAAARGWYAMLYATLLAETERKIPLRLESDPDRGCSIGVVCNDADTAADVVARLRQVADALERGVEGLAGIGVRSISDVRSQERRLHVVRGPETVVDGEARPAGPAEGRS